MKFLDVLDELSSVHIRMNGKGYSDLIRFDFKNRSIGNGEIILFKDGKVIPQTITLHDYKIELTEGTPCLENGTWEEVENLYRRYRYSVSEPYAGFAHCNFVAKDNDALSHREFMDGVKRQKARIELESYLMFHRLPWEKGHYYQGKAEKGLVVYKEWVIPQGE